MKPFERNKNEFGFAGDKTCQNHWGYSREEQVNNMIQLGLMISRLKNNK